MQIVVVTLMVLAALCFLLKQTFLSWWSVAVNTLFAAALAVLSWPVANIRLACKHIVDGRYRRPVDSGSSLAYSFLYAKSYA